MGGWIGAWIGEITNVAKFGNPFHATAGKTKGGHASALTPRACDRRKGYRVMMKGLFEIHVRFPWAGARSSLGRSHAK